MNSKEDSIPGNYPIVTYSWIGFTVDRTSFGFIGGVVLVQEDPVDRIRIDICQPKFSRDVFDPVLLAMSGVRYLDELLPDPDQEHDFYIMMVKDGAERNIYQRQASICYADPSHLAVAHLCHVDVSDREVLRGVPLARCIRLTVAYNEDWLAFFTEGADEWERRKISLGQNSKEWKKKVLSTLKRTLCPPIP